MYVPQRYTQLQLFVLFIFLYFCLHICLSRQSQILFLSDVEIFIVHVWYATQSRPWFNVLSERRGVTTFRNTQCKESC